MARKVGEIKFQAGKIFFINFGLILWGELFVDNFYWIKIFFRSKYCWGKIFGPNFTRQNPGGSKIFMGIKLRLNLRL